MDKLPLVNPHIHTPYLSHGEIYFTCGKDSHLLPGEKELMKTLFLEEEKKREKQRVVI